MSSGVRSKYNVALNGKGFMLRGAPSTPRYIKERAPSFASQLGSGDLNYNSLNGSGWSFWTQTDWSGGYQQVKFKDDATFKDGQAVDVLNKFGEVRLQNSFTSAARLSGSHTFGTHSVHELDLLIGTVKSGTAKVLKLTSANVLSTLSAYTGISAVNSMTRFKSNTLIGLTRTSGTVKTLSKYNGTAVSGFRSANPIVRAVKAIGIRAYTGEKVTSLSGDVLYYTTDLATFTSAYQAGKNRKIKIIDEINGSPYFFIEEGKRVELFRWDEFSQRAYPIYTWENLTGYGTQKFLSYMIITGTSNNRSVAYAFNGSRLWSIFNDQLQNSGYDWSRPFEFGENLHVKGGTWDGKVWVPGLYGKGPSTNRYTPFENFTNRAYGFYSSGTVLTFGYLNSSAYEVSGHVESSEFGHNIGGVEKLVNAVDINMDTLTSGQTIEVFKSVNAGGSYTSIGKASFAQDGAINKKTLYFPSGFVTKLWNCKPVLVGPGTTTPVLRDVTFQYRPIPDLRKRWNLSVDSGNSVELLNKDTEVRDGKAIMQDLWMEMEAKTTVVYEDVDAFQVQLVSAMTATNTSARVNSTRLMPPRGRVRVLKNNQIEEMSYLSADGGKVLGITRGKKNTLARSYTSADYMDNYYNVIVTDLREQVNNTDQLKTESIAQITILEV
jgi:hypothetical protein